MREKNTCYTVFSQKLMATLVLKGFVLVEMRPDRKCTGGKNVFFFKDTPELRTAVKDYQEANRRNGANERNRLLQIATGGE